MTEPLFVNLNELKLESNQVKIQQIQNQKSIIKK